MYKTMKTSEEKNDRGRPTKVQQGALNVYTTNYYKNRNVNTDTDSRRPEGRARGRRASDGRARSSPPCPNGASWGALRCCRCCRCSRCRRRRWVLPRRPRQPRLRSRWRRPKPRLRPRLPRPPPRRRAPLPLAESRGPADRPQNARKHTGHQPTATTTHSRPPSTLLPTGARFLTDSPFFRDRFHGGGWFSFCWGDAKTFRGRVWRVCKVFRSADARVLRLECQVGNGLLQLFDILKMGIVRRLRLDVLCFAKLCLVIFEIDKCKRYEIIT